VACTPEGVSPGLLASLEKRNPIEEEQLASGVWRDLTTLTRIDLLRDD
jgi:hypothetical protein